MARTTIYGELHRRSKRIAVFQASMTPKSYAAIERFTNESGHPLHILTPIPMALIGEPEKLNRYLENNRRTKGSITTAELYNANLNTIQSLGNRSPDVRTAKDLHTFTNAIKTDPNRLTMARIRQIRRMAEDNDRAIMAQLLRE